MFLRIACKASALLTRYTTNWCYLQMNTSLQRCPRSPLSPSAGPNLQKADVNWAQSYTWELQPGWPGISAREKLMLVMSVNQHAPACIPRRQAQPGDASGSEERLLFTLTKPKWSTLSGYSQHLMPGIKPRADAGKPYLADWALLHNLLMPPLHATVPRIY